MKKKGASSCKKTPAAQHRTQLCSVGLFWLCLRHQLYRRVPVSVIREICSYLPSFPVLVFLSSQAIRVFSFLQKGWRPAVALTPCLRTVNVSYCPLDSEQVLCCGGAPCRKPQEDELHGSRTAAIVHVTTGAVTPLPLMTGAREDHAVVKFEDWVYAFGGFETGGYKDPMGAPVKTAEAIHLTDLREWEFLPEMQVERTPVTACVLRTLIYLCSQGELHTFSPSARQFTQLHITVASKLGATICVKSGQLVVISEFTISLITLTEQGGHSVKTLRQDQKQVHTRCPAVVWSGLAYLMQTDRSVVVDLVTGRRPAFVQKQLVS